MKKVSNFKGIISMIKETYSSRGIVSVFKVFLGNIFSTSFFNLLSKKFLFMEKEYHYFIHCYNFTWNNERTVELPVIISMLNDKTKSVLELGNVLSHYVVINHDVVDKYEKAKGVINQDIINYNPNKKYDIIVSVSTIEHIGWDENIKDKDKSKKSLLHLRELLSDNGELIVTAPMGHNPYLDKLISEDSIFYKKIFMKRISKDNLWKEVEYKDVADIKYNSPFIAANGVFFGFIKK